jgi:hypothetical protein
VNLTLADPKFVARLTDLGGVPFANLPAQFGKFTVEFTEKWANDPGGQHQGGVIAAWLDNSIIEDRQYRHAARRGRECTTTNFYESKTKQASGTAELGSCLTDMTREGRSRRAVRDLPLCWRPSVCANNSRGFLTRWCHAKPPCRLGHRQTAACCCQGRISGELKQELARLISRQRAQLSPQVTSIFQGDRRLELFCVNREDINEKCNRSHVPARRVHLFEHDRCKCIRLRTRSISGGLCWAARRRRCQTSVPSLRQGLSLMGSAIDFTAIQCGAPPHLVPR